MKIKSLARLFVLALLLVSGSSPVDAQEPDPCSSVDPVTPGDAVTDEVSDVTAPHIDSTEVTTSLSGWKQLTVVFHLRDLPETLIFNRTGVPEGQLEYAWEALIDVGNDKQTGDRGSDYTLSAFHFIHASKSGTSGTASIENGAEASVWVPTEDGGMRGLMDSAWLEVSLEDDTITRYGAIPGLSPESRLTFGAYDRLQGSDLVGCPPSLSWGEPPPLCGDIGVTTPGDSATDSPADVRDTFAPVSDQSGGMPNAHMDITEISSSLSGETLTVVFHLADVPESLTFNRTGFEANSMEYRWEVSIDVDNDPGTGYGGGFEYLSSATHIVGPASKGDNTAVLIEDATMADVWKVGASSFGTLWRAELEVSTEEDTITLFGLVPGITAESRLAFRTDDFLGGLSDEIECQSPMNLWLAPGPCGSGEVAVMPNQTVADPIADELPAFIDFVRISTALAGETLAVVFHLRDLLADIVLDGSGRGDDVLGYGWSVSIDVDPSHETGHLGFDYSLSARYPGFPQSNDGSTAASADSQLHAYVSERIPDGFRRLEDAAIVMSPQADTVTLVGDIPGITAGSRPVFDAFVAPKISELILCQELPSEDDAGSTSSAPAEGN